MVMKKHSWDFSKEKLDSKEFSLLDIANNEDKIWLKAIDEIHDSHKEEIKKLNEEWKEKLSQNDIFWKEQFMRLLSRCGSFVD
jgi:hypothetical protein